MAQSDMRTESPRLPAQYDTLNALDWISLVLMIIGGLNWGLLGLFNLDVIATVFGSGSTLSRAVYILVGLAALYGIYLATQVGRRPSSAP